MGFSSDNEHFDLSQSRKALTETLFSKYILHHVDSQNHQNYNERISINKWKVTPNAVFI